MVFFFCLFFFQLSGGKMVWTVHNLGRHESSCPKTDYFLIRVLIWWANALVVHSEAGREKVIEHYKLRRHGKLSVVRHANFLEDYPRKIEKSLARDQLGLKGEDIVFLFFGAIRRYKGVDCLIENFLRIKDERAKLVIAGQAGDKELMRHVHVLAEKSPSVMVFDGYVTAESVPVFMSAADLFVLPSRNMFTSGSVVLAASYGLAIIAPAILSVTDAVDTRSVFRFSPTEEHALTVAMAQAVEDYESLPDRGAAAFASVACWGWTEAAKATGAIYDKVLGRH
ncbi:MAG: glycosyltransferase family 4 protein [Planctomycetota bacterium]